MELRNRDSSHRHGVHANAKKEMSNRTGSIKRRYANDRALNNTTADAALDKRPFFRKSPVVAASRNRWQMGGRRERLRQAKTLAVGCDELPESFHGKGRVDSTSLLLKRGSRSSLRKEKRAHKPEGSPDSVTSVTGQQSPYETPTHLHDRRDVPSRSGTALEQTLPVPAADP